MSSDKQSYKQHTDELALEELKILSAIIDRHEQTEYKIRGFCLALIAALTAGFFAKETELIAWGYILLSIIISAGFFMFEVFHRVPKLKAFKRADIVEEYLRSTEGTYDGPKIGLSLRGERWSLLREATKGIPTYGPYIMVAVVCFFIGITGSAFSK
jgi:hypothetical protein